jgi:hypothetical protein
MRKKTKEMIFFFFFWKTTIRSMNMYDSEVERITSFKLLETWLSQIAQKIWGRQRRICYNSIGIIGSTLEYGDVLWHGGLTNAQSANIERVKKRAFRIILPGVEYFVTSVKPS